MMKHAAAMVGNSSSGITEAASFRLPVVNIGSRQGGRLRAANIIDVEPQADAIARRLKQRYRMFFWPGSKVSLIRTAMAMPRSGLYITCGRHRWDRP